MPKRQQAIIWSQDGLLYRHMNVQIPNYHGEMDIISNVPAAHMQPNVVSALAPKSSIHLPLQAIYTVLLYARLKNGTYYAVAMSVRPSVCVFRTYLQHALRYQFESWYIHSVGGTTCRVWVASQLGHFDLVYSQKLVKLIFLQSWPHKSR